MKINSLRVRKSEKKKHSSYRSEGKIKKEEEEIKLVKNEFEEYMSDKKKYRQICEKCGTHFRSKGKNNKICGKCKSPHWLITGEPLPIK